MNHTKLITCYLIQHLQFLSLPTHKDKKFRVQKRKDGQCVCERDRERAGVCVCEGERDTERESVCVCVCERERERERERAGVCV